jgi:DNA-directed RNA polymerase specialized sigma24 family protein
MNDVTAGQTTTDSTSVWTVEAVFTAYHPWLRTWIFRHLFKADWHLAEDLASEVFTRLIATHGDRSIEAPRVQGLLAKVARCVISDHFRVQRSGESPVDFSDPIDSRSLPTVAAAEDTAVVRLQAREMLADRPYTTLAETLARVDALFAMVVAA